MRRQHDGPGGDAGGEVGGPERLEIEEAPQRRVHGRLLEHRGQRDIAVGKVFGSNLFTLLSVLGLSGLVSPGPDLGG